MPKEHRMSDEIEVTVSGFFTTHHRFQTEAGIRGELTFPAFASSAVFRGSGGRELLMQKVHWLGNAHELVDGEVVRGTADKQSFWGREFVVRFDERRYVLAPGGFLDQGWYLVNDEGTRLLKLHPRGILNQGSHLTLTGPIEVELLAFAYYLVHVRKQEESAAVAASAS